MKYRGFLSAPLLLVGSICLFCANAGCKTKSVAYEPTYSFDTATRKILLFGLPSQSYYEVTSPFVAYLNHHMVDAQVQAVASSSFLGYNDKLDQQYFHFTIASGVKALESSGKGYSIIAKAVDEAGNAGAILVHKDSSINSFMDLKGKTIATPGPPALPGHMLQMLFLNKNGIDVKKDISLRYVESFESVYLNVYLGKCAAGFSTTTSWRSFVKSRPEIASRVILKWETEKIIGNAFLVRTNMDRKLSGEIENLILSMHKDPEGKKALANIGFLRFDSANSGSYKPVKKLLDEYNAQVGKL